MKSRIEDDSIQGKVLNSPNYSDDPDYRDLQGTRFYADLTGRSISFFTIQV